MNKKIDTLEDFYNYLCDSTQSTWTCTVIDDSRHMFQDLCLDLDYVKKVSEVLEPFKGAYVVGVQENMIFVLYNKEKATSDID